MEENNEEKQSNFKTVKNPSNVKTVKEKKEKTSLGFGRGFLVPFISGVLGCSVVIGTCFGVPSIREYLLGNSKLSSNNTSSSNLSTGYVNQNSLSNYSDTSVFAANKILPSIVGIKVEYNVNSMFSMFGRQSQPSTATATGSGIIISEDGYI